MQGQPQPVRPVGGSKWRPWWPLVGVQPILRVDKLIGWMVVILLDITWYIGIPGLFGYAVSRGVHELVQIWLH